MSHPFNSTADKFVSKGIPVIPIAPNAKRPVNELGLRGASPDPDRIREWKRKNNPECNIAIPTGAASGLLVVDIDMDRSKNGEAQWNDIVEENGGEMPETLEVITPRGGRHIYFNYPCTKLIRSRTNHPRRNVDIRAEGGYVLVPPSTVDGKQYKYAKKNKVVDCPKWLIKILQDPERKPAPPRVPWTGSKTEHQSISHALNFIDSSDYFTWVRVGMAIYNECPDNAGFMLFDDWSAQCSEKYDHDATARKWKTFATSSGQVKLGTLFFLAKQGGWKPKEETEFDIRRRSGYFR